MVDGWWVELSPGGLVRRRAVTGPSPADRARGGPGRTRADLRRQPREAAMRGPEPGEGGAEEEEEEEEKEELLVAGAREPRPDGCDGAGRGVVVVVTAGLVHCARTGSPASRQPKGSGKSIIQRPGRGGHVLAGRGLSQQTGNTMAGRMGWAGSWRPAAPGHPMMQCVSVGCRDSKGMMEEWMHIPTHEPFFSRVRWGRRFSPRRPRDREGCPPKRPCRVGGGGHWMHGVGRPASDQQPQGTTHLKLAGFPKLHHPLLQPAPQHGAVTRPLLSRSKMGQTMIHDASEAS